MEENYSCQDGKTRIHVYTDRNGNVLAEKHIIKQSDGKKRCYWYSTDPKTEKKAMGLNGTIMPLYHADKLHTSKSETVWFAEGEKDVETLERCFNFLATCTSNGGRQATWHDDLYNADLEGRSIGIFTDNDEVGENYGDFIAKNVCKIAKSVKIIPIKAIWAECPEKGDISDAVEALGKDKVLELLSSAIKKIKDYEPETNEKQSNNRTNNKIADLPNWIQLNNRGMSVNPELLAEYIMNTESYIFVQLREQESQQCYWYQNGVYVRISAKHIKARIRAIIQKYYTEIAKIRVIEDTYKHITYPDEKHFVSDESLLDADENIINFQNGVLHLDTMELKEHSPKYLSTIQIPCNWNPNSKSPDTFSKYILHLAGDDSDNILTLIQAIGFAISNVKIERFKKSIFLFGAGNSGKSIFLKFMSSLVGKENFSAMPFAELEKRFSTSMLYRKRLAGDDDCNYCTSASASVFKIMTGGGELMCEEKGKQGFHFVFNGLYIVCANKLPLFGGDKGNHVYDRIIPIRCGQSIPENQRDKKLLEKLHTEREAIVHLAVIYLKKAIEDNYNFVISEKSKKLLEEYKIENDIVLQFIDECCEPRVTYNDNVTTKVLYDAFKTWCFQNGEKYIPKKAQFSESLCNFYGVEPAREGRKKIKSKVNGFYYYPHTLTKEAKNELHVYDQVESYS